VRFQRAPLLTARDHATGPLVAAQLNLSLSTVYVYDIGTTGAPATRISGTAPGSNLHDISVDKYGETLLTGAGSRNATRAYATADLSGRGSYYTGYYVANGCAPRPAPRWPMNWSKPFRKPSVGSPAHPRSSSSTASATTSLPPPAAAHWRSPTHSPRQRPPTSPGRRSAPQRRLNLVTLLTLRP
jgi:hypothetical protein